MMCDGRGMTNAGGCERPGHKAACGRKVSFVIPTPAVTFSECRHAIISFGPTARLATNPVRHLPLNLPFSCTAHRYTVPLLHERNTQGLTF